MKPWVPLLLAGHLAALPAAGRVLVDPEHPTHMLVESAEGRRRPYHHLAKSAYVLLAPDVEARRFVRDARSDGFDTLRILLMVHWPPRYDWSVNPWSHRPGAPRAVGDPQREWWAEFDESRDGYWRRLDRLLGFMARRDMVANLCLFDHATLTFLESEGRGEGARFLVHPGTPLDDGRLHAFLDRLARALEPHENYYLEIGNQIARAWYRRGVVSGRYPHPYMIAPGGDHPPTCGRWMSAVARRLLSRFPAERPPLVTDSSRYHEDRAFTPVSQLDWCGAVSFHSMRSEDWYVRMYEQLAGAPGLNSGFVQQFAKPVIDNEPMTDGHPERPGYRDADPDHHRIHSWLTIMGGGYKTYHSEPSIHCTPNRDLPAGEEAGKAYLGPLRRFWIDSDLAYRELQPAWGVLRPEPAAVRLFVRAKPDRSEVVAYLLGSLDDAVRLHAELPPGAYEAIWFDPTAGRSVTRVIGADRPAVLEYPAELGEHWDAAVRIRRWKETP